MLYSTKRKLHNLINGPAPPSTPSAVPSTPPPDKRRRPDDDTSSDPAQSSIRAISPTGSFRTYTSSTFTTVTNLSHQTSTKASPSYAPWDRDAFLARLATFRYVDKWSAKPTSVNEVVWAKRGWVCAGKERVRCVACKQEVVVRVGVEDEDSEEGKGVVEKYEHMVESEHESSCLWRKRGCDDQIYKLPVGAPSKSIPAFVERYHSLSKIRAELPPALSYPSQIKVESLALPAECTDAAPLSESAAILAMFGWQNEEPGIPGLVTCTACFRRLGLWLFKKPAEETESSMSRLDVISEHRDYCPWISRTSQASKHAGWAHLHKTLTTATATATASATTIAGSPSAASTIDEPERELTEAEKDARSDGNIKKLKRLRSLYFGKGKKKDGGGRKSAPSSRPGTAGAADEEEEEGEERNRWGRKRSGTKSSVATAASVRTAGAGSELEK